MDSSEMKPRASQPPWRPPGAGASARSQRDDRRSLPPPPPPPSPPRAPPPLHPALRPPPPPTGRAANAPRGEGHSAVRGRGEAEGAGAGDTRRGTARREAVAREAPGSAEERISDGTGRKRWMAPPEQEQPSPKQRKTACRGSCQAPPDYWKHIAVPLGRNRDTDNSRPRTARPEGGSGAREKAAPRPPRAASKEGVPLGGALPRATGNKVPAADGARPVALGGRHGTDTKSSEALRQSNVAAADGLRNAGSQGAAGNTVKDGGRGAGTRELQKKEQVPFKSNATSFLGTGKDEELEVHPVQASTRHSTTKKTSDNRLQSGEKSLSRALNKSGGGSCNAVAKSSAQGPSRDHLNGKRVPEIGRMNRVFINVPARISSKSTMTGNKIVRAPGVPIAQKNELATNSKSFGPKKKARDWPPIKVISPSGSKENLDSKVAFYLKDDDVLKAAAFVEGELKLYIRNSSNRPSSKRHMIHGVQNADARRKFKMICRRFEFICRVLIQAVEQRLLNLDGGRMDCLAYRAMRKLPDFSKPDPIVGKFPGVEVGDEFLYRVQVYIAGLHCKCWGGIDWTKDPNGTPIATSIVSSGYYPDELSCSGELIYTGSGGKLAGKKHDEDQQLEGGNLALENSIKTKNPVRVIYGFESHHVEGQSYSRAKKFSMYIYDGLYQVMDSFEEGEQGSMMLKYMLKKIPGQPELPLHIAKQMRKSKIRRHMLDTSETESKEGTRICVMNTIDNNVRPAPFEYITRIKYALSPTEVRTRGCGCTNGCSDSGSCSCAGKNGGKFPFIFNGAIVSESSLIFECGPSCNCPLSCQNRVGQQGIKLPLQVFRTSKTGWGVRCLRSIPAGSFVCEYVGELRHSLEADLRKNSDYLFNIGHNKVSQPQGSGLKSSGTCTRTMDVGFTIDATQCGNIGRFINHSRSPNLFAQKVLFDHGDKRMPHIMFFAAETIPPLQELTCEYK